MDTSILVTKNVENSYGLFVTQIFENKKKIDVLIRERNYYYESMTLSENEPFQIQWYL